LGQELVEVAVPIFGDEKEPLGTIRYGLSTQRMRKAFADAKADAKAQQLRSIVLIGATVTLATLMGILLSHLQAVRITRPVQELTQAATDLAGGDRSVRVKIGSGDELELLGFSFNRMVWELGSSYEKLEDLNRNLERKVEERTEALASRNQDMRAVLDNVDQGLITLTPEGRMAAERSAAVDGWFGAPKAGQSLWEYLQDTSPSFALSFEVGWDQIVSDFLPLEVAIGELPKRLSTGSASYDFRYLPLLRDEKLHSVLVVIADVTSQLLLEREEAESRELTQAFRRLSKDRAGFMAFLREAGQLFDAVWAAGTDAPGLKSALHTLKGNASLMGLAVIAKLCHQLEDELASTGGMSEATLAQLQARWQSLNEDIAQLSPSEMRLVEVPDAEHAELVALLERAGQTEALGRVLGWKLEPAARSLSRLAEQAQALAQRLGKGELDAQVRPSSARLDPTRFGPLFSELSHVMRNAVDHGLESPDERSAAGKKPNGQLTLSATAKGDSVTIEIADDGRGIDWEAIRVKGGRLGLPCRTPADLLGVLCHEGFSTRSEVTEISGRGVGMAAVKQRVENMGGRLEVRSSLGQGTTWSISVPLRGRAQHRAAS
jgi:two-component system, chemotaxis family, sensor kinase CheA